MEDNFNVKENYHLHHNVQHLQTIYSPITDMHKVETLPPADFHVKISALGEIKAP